MSTRFEGRTVIVTGASRGLGRALAVAFAREGAFVYLGYRVRAAGAAETARIIQEAGGDAVALPFDVQSAAAVRESVERVVAERGVIDVLVNNAGLARDALLLAMSDDDWNAVMAVNASGVFYACRAAARSMIAAGRGSIVNVASVAGLRASPGQVNYSASKGAIVAMTRSLGSELAPSGVRVNAVVPGFLSTGMASRLDHRVADKRRAAIPLGRFGDGGEVAKAALFLASDDASYIVGQSLVVDGGLSL